MGADELYTEEITKLIAKVRIAKMHGFSMVTIKFSEHRIVDIRTELIEPREDILSIYKNQLTLGTSGLKLA